MLIRQSNSGHAQIEVKGSSFLKSSVLHRPKTQFTCGRKAKPHRKSYIFQKYPCMCGLSLRLTTIWFRGHQLKAPHVWAAWVRQEQRYKRQLAFRKNRSISVAGMFQPHSLILWNFVDRCWSKASVNNETTSRLGAWKCNQFQVTDYLTKTGIKNPETIWPTSVMSRIIGL